MGVVTRLLPSGIGHEHTRGREAPDTIHCRVISLQMPTGPRCFLHWLYLGIAIVAEVVGTSFLKTSAGFTKLLPTVMVAVGYGLAFFFLSLTVDKVPTAIAYAVWSGAGVTLIAVIGWLFLGQKLDGPALVGIGLIVAGVVVLNLFSKSAAH